MKGFYMSRVSRLEARLLLVTTVFMSGQAVFINGHLGSDRKWDCKGKATNLNVAAELLRQGEGVHLEQRLDETDKNCSNCHGCSVQLQFRESGQSGGPSHAD